MSVRMARKAGDASMVILRGGFRDHTSFDMPARPSPRPLPEYQERKKKGHYSFSRSVHRMQTAAGLTLAAISSAFRPAPAPSPPVMVTWFFSRNLRTLPDEMAIP